MKASLFCEKANLLRLQVHTLTASTHSVSSWPPPYVGAFPADADGRVGGLFVFE